MFLTTKGSKIVDSSGKDFQITGINWFGFETSNLAPHGIWQRNYKEMVRQIAELGFNTVRLPFCNDLLLQNSLSTGIDFGLNPTLEKLSPIEIMMEVVKECAANGLRVILDRHRPTSKEQSEFWYTDKVTEMQWMSDWALLASIFKDHDNVIGADLHNEPHEACTWDYWSAAATKCGNIIHSVNPNWLIIVQGVQYYNGTSYWWGGNLQGVRDNPIELNNLVYSTHDYPASIYPQDWFSAPSYPVNLASVWDEFWGFIETPVLVGEFGSKLKTESDIQWLKTLLEYMKDRFHFTYWCLNPNSGDTGGILESDWVTVEKRKMSMLKPYLKGIKK